MADTPPAHVQIRIAAPDPFDGSKASLTPFLRTLALSFVAYGLRTDEQKIVFTLSYMKGGLAGPWADAYTDRALHSDDWGTWEEFMTSLHSTFGDHDEEKTAQHRLDALRQGRKPAEEFFLEFDQLAQRAKYSVNHDSYLISLLEKALHPGLVDRIYAVEPLPVTYLGWKRKAIALDQLWRRREERKRVVREFWTPEKKGPERPVTKPQIEARTFGGRGQPMEVDRAKAAGLCFQCGKQGHIRRNCPEKTTEAPRPMVRARELNVKEWTGEEKMRIFEALMKEREAQNDEGQDFCRDQE